MISLPVMTQSEYLHTDCTNERRSPIERKAAGVTMRFSRLSELRLRWRWPPVCRNAMLNGQDSTIGSV